jgi:hypothetical protein
MKEDITLVASTQIYRCVSDDRLVIVYKNNDRITGINYAQDADMDYDEFVCGWGNSDRELTDFYFHVKQLARGRDLSEIELINEVIWVHHTYTDKIDE